MRKTCFCICKKQRRRSGGGYFAADQRLCFRYRYYKPLAIFCGCTAQCLSDLVENPKDRFSCDVARMKTEHPDLASALYSYLHCSLSLFLTLSCCLLIFFKINFFKKFFQEYHQSVKQFDLGPGSGTKLFAIKRRYWQAKS